MAMTITQVSTSCYASEVADYPRVAVNERLVDPQTEHAPAVAHIMPGHTHSCGGCASGSNSPLPIRLGRAQLHHVALCD
jgi:hypothetical protein